VVHPVSSYDLWQGSKVAAKADAVATAAAPDERVPMGVPILRGRGVGQLQAGRETSTLAAVLAAVERLDWLLQGHFTGEEDGLFLPAEALLSPATVVELSRQMASLSSEPAA
jgi:hypothetical protein